MLTYLCAKTLIDSRVNEMYESLGIEPVREEPVYPKVRTAKKAKRVEYVERVGVFLIRAGEKLLQSTRNNNVSQEVMS